MMRLAVSNELETALSGVNMLAMIGPIAALTAAFIAVGAAVSSVTKIITNLDELAASSQGLENLVARTGMQTSDIKSLQVQLTDLKISADTLPVALKFLQKNLVDGKTSFEGFTITAKDTKGALIQLADQFEKMPDGPNKTRMALAL